MTIELTEEERDFLMQLVKNHRDYYAVLSSRPNQEKFRFFDGLWQKLQLPINTK